MESKSRLALAMGIASVFASAAGCAGETRDEDREILGAARQAVTSCVTIQRGTAGGAADATISAAQPNQNFGAGADLRVTDVDEVLIKFNLEPIPSDAYVESATLQLTRGSSFAYLPIIVRRALVDWAEGSVTFASFNQQSATESSGLLLWGAPGTVASVDVTKLARSWVSGALPNHGVVLEAFGNTRAKTPTLYVSSESPTAAPRPSLQVCYSMNCAPNPCQNGGTCQNVSQGYTCACPAGFTGMNCEIDVDDCAANPCQNGGTCADGIDSYTCACPPGFTGANCQINVDECAPGPCQNGGTCVDGVNGYTCQCPPGFVGGNCETPLPYSHTFTIDGVNEFTSGETFTTSTGGFTGYISWDAGYLYVGARSNDIASNSGTKWALIYLSGPGASTTTGVKYNTQQPGLPFPAKYHLRWKTNNSYTNAQVWNGGAWVDAGWNFSGHVFQSGTFLEWRIPRADIGSPSSVSLVMSQINEQPFAESTFGAVPFNTLSDGYDRDFGKYYQFNLLSPNAPASYAPLP